MSPPSLQYWLIYLLGRDCMDVHAVRLHSHHTPICWDAADEWEECGGVPVQVRTKSPMPARPPMVMGCAPLATARRVISTRPRVMRAALALLPNPRPSEMPQAMASTFFNAPPISTPVYQVVAGYWCCICKRQLTGIHYMAGHKCSHKCGLQPDSHLRTIMLWV